MYQSKNNGGITVAMLRAFVCMSRNLNLSKTCEELGATRQTVRRHLNDLERIKGEQLFEVTDRQYRLTPQGEACLDGAKSLIIHLDAWSGQNSLTKNFSEGLESSRFLDADGLEFLSQQHPVSKIALNGLPLLKRAFVAWGNAETQIEHTAMESIRPFSVLYRKGPAGWVFVDIGEHSAYAKWFGWARKTLATSLTNSSQGHIPVFTMKVVFGSITFSLISRKREAILFLSHSKDYCLAESFPTAPPASSFLP